MHDFILQDWTTIRGGSGLSTVIQAENDWLDLSPYQDVVFWIEVSEATNSLISLQTSPSKDEDFFVSIVSQLTLAPSVSVVPVLMTASVVPVARYVRWLLNGTTGTWDATFRVVLAANSPGM
jgi:hypothetical protein